MERFVPTVDPAYDMEVSRNGVIVVLSHDQEEIRLLTFNQGTWFVTGYPSQNQAGGKVVPDVDFYYGGIGYVLESHGYASFSKDTGIETWDQVYEDLAYASREMEDETDQLFLHLAKGLPAGTFHTDDNGDITYVSSQWQSITGLSPKKSIGTQWVKHVPTPHRSEVISKWRDCVLKDKPFKSIFPIKIGSSRRWIMVHASHAETGEMSDDIVGYIGVVSDVTAIKAVEASLKDRVHHQIEQTAAEKARYWSIIRDVLDRVEGGMFILDKNFEVVWVNARICEFFGLNREEVIGKNKELLINHTIQHIFEDPKTFQETVLATYADNTHVKQFQCHVLEGENRKERWLEHRSAPITHGYYVGGRVETYHDITHQVHQQRMYQQQAHTMMAVADEIPVFIAYIKPDETYVFANRSYRRWIWQREDPIAGRTVREVVGETVYNQIKDRIQTVLRGEKVQFTILIPQRAKEAYIVYVPHIYHGKVIGFCVVIKPDGLDWIHPACFDCTNEQLFVPGGELALERLASALLPIGKDSHGTF